MKLAIVNPWAEELLECERSEYVQGGLRTESSSREGRIKVDGKSELKVSDADSSPQCLRRRAKSFTDISEWTFDRTCLVFGKVHYYQYRYTTAPLGCQDDRAYMRHMLKQQCR